MLSGSKVCALVDAYSTARDYPGWFAKHGYSCIHIQSTPEPLPVFRASFSTEQYLTNIVHRGDLEETAAAVKKYAPVCLIAGIEPGVLLADALSERLNLLTNGTHASLARRDKFEMAETLRRKNIPAVRQFKASREEDVLRWVRSLKEWPIVVKPLNSAGTDGVTVCHSDDDVRRACRNVLQKQNIMGLMNHEVLVQEYLHGTEYVINTVSHHGQHHVTDIWRSTKQFVPGAASIYDLEELLPLHGEEQSALVNYLRSVLDALEIQYGPAHSELMLTKHGPILIETGARLAGVMNHAAIALCVGHSQLELTVDAYVNTPAFLNIASKPYEMKKGMFTIDFISHFEGIVKEIPMLEEIRQLPTLYDFYIKPTPGASVRRTVDLHSSPGAITLVSEDRAALERDYRRIRELEKTGFVLLPPEGI